MTQAIVKLVDNRVFLLGLDYLYREQMKIFEQEILLPAVSELIHTLKTPVLELPIEGYYYETEKLTEYFLKVRSLQKNTREHADLVKTTAAYQLLSTIFSSSIYGFKQAQGFFPQSLDSLYFALTSTPVSTWSISSLVAAAQTISLANHDISLVGLAASIGDSVVLTALRESVALYAAVAAGCALGKEPPIVQYVWQVDEQLQDRANQFIEIFNLLTNSQLPLAQAHQAKIFYTAYEQNNIFQRCIYLGFNDSKLPMEYYHWAIGYENGQPISKDFWSKEVWTTEKYQG